MVWFTPELLEVLKKQMYMSPETWQRVIAADPTGWREMLEGEQNG